MPISFSEVYDAIKDAPICDARSQLLGLGGPPYDIAFMLNGVPTASQCLLRVDMVRTVVFAINMYPSKGKATAATAQATLLVYKNGVQVGSIQWAAGGTIPSFIMATQTVFSPGDILTVLAPASPDATLGDIGVVLAGSR